MVMDLKGTAYNELAPEGGHGSQTYRIIVPAGSVPAIRDGGFVLRDSEAIIEYLEDIYPERSMRPADAKLRAQLRAVARYHDTRLEPAIRAFYAQVMPVEKQDRAAIEAAFDVMSNRLNRLSKMIKPSPFLGGEILSLYDLAYPTTLGMIKEAAEWSSTDFSFPENIQEWQSAMEENVIVQQAVKVCRTELREWMDNRL